MSQIEPDPYALDMRPQSETLHTVLKKAEDSRGAPGEILCNQEGAWPSGPPKKRRRLLLLCDVAEFAKKRGVRTEARLRKVRWLVVMKKKS